MKKKVIAISGSTRAQSSNSDLIRYIARTFADIFDFEIYSDIDKLPHFNPDLDNENVPEKVSEFRKKLKGADCILICSPEYAMGVPGTLKNAIDWTVSSMEFSKKPTALITASSLGEKAHRSLLETLKIIEAKVTEDTQLLISQVKTKIREGEITDEETRIAISFVMQNLNLI